MEYFFSFLLNYFNVVPIYKSFSFLSFLPYIKQQETRSGESAQNAYDALEVTDNNGVFISYKDEESVRTYETKSLDVNIRIKDLEKLGD